jgi:hypothetical protein
MPSDHHHLVQVDLIKLRPTQITVGYAEVVHKRREWAGLARKARRDLLESHCFPAALGPRERYYIVDHHHLGLALHEEGVERISVMLLEDLSYLEPPIFWRVMEQRRWAHPFDQSGARRDYDAIPSKLAQLVDDPYRSLAGFLRTAGGYAKDASPFAEFMWADYLRQHITPQQIETSMDAVVRDSLGLASSPQARYLPGWSGRSPAVGH